MRITSFLCAIAAIAAFKECVYSQTPAIALPYISKVWVADQGDGTYQNPILHADYSDPDVVRVGDDFYLTASSFNCVPGLPILHSRDLVNWNIIGHALPKQLPPTHYALPRHGNGVWAPCLRYHRGVFYIYWGDPDFGIYMVRSQYPAGEWSPPVLVKEGKGLIDPSPLWDDDGQAWLVHGWAASRAGVNSLLTLVRLDAAGEKALDEGRHIFDGHDAHPTIEGPKLYKRNGYYYIFAPAGGVATGWQLVLRSKNIYGPYEEKIALAQGSTNINGPHQGAWVETAGGESWFIHFQDKGAYGRVVHLQPMRWQDDWPVIGAPDPLKPSGPGQPVLRHLKPLVNSTSHQMTPAESDEFDADGIGLQWQWHANPSIAWYAKLPGTKHLRLFPLLQPGDKPNLWMTPNLLLQKFPAPSFTATTSMSWHVDSLNREGKRAGLLVMGDDYAGLVMSKDDKGFKISKIICKNAPAGQPEQVETEQYISSNKAYLRVEITGPPAVCRFSFSTDGQRFMPLGAEFMAKTDTWIGAKLGLFASSTAPGKRGGYADFEWFRVE